MIATVLSRPRELLQQIFKKFGYKEGFFCVNSDFSL